MAEEKELIHGRQEAVVLKGAGGRDVCICRPRPQ